MDYTFNINVNFPSYMQSQILALGLGSTILNIQTNAATNPMTVILSFNNTLSDSDLISLNNFMNTYVDPVVTPNSINAIMTALNTDENVIMLARVRIKQTIPLLDTLTLLQVCSMLGINPNL